MFVCVYARMCLRVSVCLFLCVEVNGLEKEIEKERASMCVTCCVGYARVTPVTFAAALARSVSRTTASVTALSTACVRLVLFGVWLYACEVTSMVWRCECQNSHGGGGGGGGVGDKHKQAPQRSTV